MQISTYSNNIVIIKIKFVCKIKVKDFKYKLVRI
jgi:hypothetical protein